MTTGNWPERHAKDSAYKPLEVNFILAGAPGPCWSCGNPTRYVEVNFEAFMCPGPCQEHIWGSYYAALAGVGGAVEMWRIPRSDNK